MELRIITEGLDFAEGPVPMADGSILVVEMLGGRLTRVLPDGSRRTVATTGGGPNGAAIGPDGRCWITNNGGYRRRDYHGMMLPADAPLDTRQRDLRLRHVRLEFLQARHQRLDGGEKILALKPMTYMNSSGESVQEAAGFFKLPTEQITAFHDELDLAPGKMRVKKGGGAAGHRRP